MVAWLQQEMFLYLAWEGWVEVFPVCSAILGDSDVLKNWE
jgi:hypothetical protein